MRSLDPNSPIPLYYQLKQILRSWILTGKYESKQQFPSERELQELYDVSRMTIRRTLSELVSEGFLVRKQGRGSFVIKPRLQDRLGSLTSFTEDMRQRELPTRARVVLIQLVFDKEVAQKMSVLPEEELVKLQRLRFVGGEPIALQTAFVRHRFCPGLVERTLDSGSLYKTLENGYGLHIGHAQQVFEAKPADEYEARMLEIKTGYPVLMLERLTYLHNREPIEYVRSVYRGDKYRFTVELKR